MSLISFPDLPVAISKAIFQAKGSDPMAGVAVVVANSRAANNLRLRVARERGLANVSFLTAPRLAEQLLESQPNYQRRHPLSADVRREITRIVLRDAQAPISLKGGPRSFSGGPHSTSSGPGAVRTLIKSFSELRRRSSLEIQMLIDQGSLAAEIVRLYGEYRKLAADYSDSRSAVEVATQLVAAAPAVVLVQTEPLLAYEQDFFLALKDAGKLTVVSALVGEADLDQMMLSFGVDYGPDAKVNIQPVRPDFDVLVAPDPDVEVRSAVSRLLVEAQRGTPFSEMGLIFGARHPYAEIAFESLSRAGIPITGKSPRKLDQSGVGRFFAGLMSVIETDFAFVSVQNWLTSVPFRSEDPAGLPVDVWLDLAKRARVVHGDHWEARLTEQTEEVKGREAIAAQACAFVADAKRWSGQNRTRWSDWAHWAWSAVDKYLDNSVVKTWPEDEQRALQSMRKVFDRLARLDAFGASADKESFVVAVLDELDAPQSNTSEPGGVFVGTVSEAVGSPFTYAVLCGLGESVYPTRSSKDALATAIRVPGAESDELAQRRQFLTVLASCQSLSLSMARADQKNQRELRPSPFLLEVSSAKAGKAVSSEDLIHAHLPWVSVVPSFQSFVADRSRMPLTNDEVALSELAASGSVEDLSAGSAAMARGVELIQARSGHTMTAFDGIVGPQPALQMSKSRPLSSSQLETWATCPFRYFLRSELKVGNIPDEDAPFDVDARRFGNLMHEVLQRFLTKYKVEPDHVWTEEERADLQAMGDSEISSAQLDGRVPIGLLGESQRQLLTDALDTFCVVDSERRRNGDFIPASFEYSFGGKDLPITVNRPDGPPIFFRGRIDRIDRSRDGRRMVAYDYKTSKPSKISISKDPVGAGKHIQAALYRYVLSVIADVEGRELESIDGAYWFLKAPKAKAFTSVPDAPTTHDRLIEVVIMAAQGIEGGVFPLFPGKDDRDSYVNCRHCDYDSLCPTDRAQAWARKSDDDVVAPFVGLEAQ